MSATKQCLVPNQTAYQKQFHSHINGVEKLIIGKKYSKFEALEIVFCEGHFSAGKNYPWIIDFISSMIEADKEKLSTVKLFKCCGCVFVEWESSF